MERPMQTLVELDAVRSRHPQVFESGSADENAAIARFQQFFARFATDGVDTLLASTYAPDVYFNDCLKEVRGKVALSEYLRGSTQAIEDCRVEYEEITRNRHGEYLVRWRMMIRFRKFSRGKDTWSIGISHLRFDAGGLVVYQQDYWNAADGLYQHIPLLGAVMRAIRKRL